MQKIEVLNNIAHEHLRVNHQFSTELGDNLASTLAYATEFAEIQKEYPILFRKNADSGEYQAIVFFGFQKDENLFLIDANQAHVQNLRTYPYPGWRAQYVPAVIARGPFSIGIQREIMNGSEVHNPVVHVDVNHPKVQDSVGQNLFLENGGNSAYLNHISRVLDTINNGIVQTKLMFDAFNKFQLLENVVLDIEFHNQQKLKITGFETINANKLVALDGAALEELNRSGFLQLAYFALASMSNIKKLIDWKNQKIATGDSH